MGKREGEDTVRAGGITRGDGGEREAMTDGETIEGEGNGGRRVVARGGAGHARIVVCGGGVFKWRVSAGLPFGVRVCV